MTPVTPHTIFDSEQAHHLEIGQLVLELIANHFNLDSTTLSLQAEDTFYVEMGGVETLQDCFDHLHKIAAKLSS